MTAPAAPLSRYPAPWLWIVGGAIFFLLATWFFTRNNQFPVTYHPDEAAKGRQIVSGERNFHHPLLLLESARLVMGVSGHQPSVQEAVRAGRMVSAVFAALAVLLLAVFATRRGGWGAGLLTLALVPLHPLLYELAHYCKEDPALLLGLAAALLALDVFMEHPRPATALALGAACALALSGKYLGVIMLVPSLSALVVQRTLPGAARRWGWFAAGFVAVLVLINFQALLRIPELTAAIGSEWGSIQAGGAKGLSRDIPHAKYWWVFQENTGWPMQAGICLCAASLFLRLLRGSQTRLPDVVLLVLPLAYALILSFSPKTAARYFLTASPFLITAGCLGLGRLIQLTRQTRWQMAGVTLVLAAGLVTQWTLTAPVVRGFAHDSRQEMARWIAAHMPGDQVLGVETRTQLAQPEMWTTPPPVMREARFLPDLGSIESLRASGVAACAIIRTSYGGYLDTRRKPSPDQAAQYQQRASFYRELTTRGRLLHRTGGMDPEILNPEIRLHELPPAAQ